MNTFGRNLQLSALDDLDLFERLVAGFGSALLNLFNNVVALEDLAKDDVTTIKPPRILSVSPKPRFCMML